MQPEIETEGIFDSERNGNKADMDSVRVCMWACMLCVRDMHRRVGAGVQVLCGYVCVQVWYAMQVSVCRYDALCGTGRRDGVRMQGMRYADMHERAIMRYAAGEACKNGQKWG